MVPVNDMSQGISRHRVSQLCSCCHHAFEVRPTTRNVNGRFKRCAIRLCRQQGSAQILEGAQGLAQ